MRQSLRKSADRSSAVGRIRLDALRTINDGPPRRVLPALASLLGVGIDRERLAREALEAETLRRSDAVKRAVLLAVSHDLRSPLMAILASASTLACPDLIAVHVIRPGARRSRDSDLADLRRLVAEVGASWQELKGEDTAGTLIGFARRYHMTQIVLGPVSVHAGRSWQAGGPSSSESYSSPLERDSTSVSSPGLRYQSGDLRARETASAYPDGSDL
jgi:K+-sensing histidine kinase KdpD